MFGRFFGASRRARILKLLDQERHLILNGPLADLQPLVARREKAIAELDASAADLPKDFLVALREGATRNQSLLAASLEGARSARKQLETILAAAGELGTYTTDGEPAPKPMVRITRDLRA